MLRIVRILVTTTSLALSVAGLSSCGQTGALYLPTDPAAANRATLPESLRPFPKIPATPAPVAPLTPHEK
ncbi:MAG: lipoprotein [Burkholderiaceae bacterium]